jgi:hypothetical protein
MVMMIIILVVEEILLLMEVTIVYVLYFNQIKEDMEVEILVD